MTKRIDLWTIRRTIRKYAENLRSLENTKLVCLARKERADKITNEWAINVVVEKKGGVDKQNTVPRYLRSILKDGSYGEKIQTDVTVLSTSPKSFGLKGGHLVLSHDNERGVLFIASSQSGNSYAITNAHVVTDVDQSGLSGPVAAFDPLDNRFEKIGATIAATPIKSNQINDLDAALIKLDSHIPISKRGIINEVQPVVAFDYFRTEETSRFFYRAGNELLECRRPRPVLSTAEVVVEGKVVQFSDCWRLEMVSSGNRPGHSGSLIFKRTGSGLVACGILFAGIEDKEAWAFTAERAVNRLRPYMS